MTNNPQKGLSDRALWRRHRPEPEHAEPITGFDANLVAAWLEDNLTDEDWPALEARLAANPAEIETLRAAAALQPAFMLSIAPPVGRSWDFDTLVLPTCPWLVIQGDADEIVDPQAVRSWVEAMPAPPQLVRMPDTSHFFHRKLLDLRGAIKHGVRAYLPASA